MPLVHDLPPSLFFQSASLEAGGNSHSCSMTQLAVFINPSPNEKLFHTSVTHEQGGRLELSKFSLNFHQVNPIVIWKVRSLTWKIASFYLGQFLNIESSLLSTRSELSTRSHFAHGVESHPCSSEIHHNMSKADRSHHEQQPFPCSKHMSSSALTSLYSQDQTSIASNYPSDFKIFKRLKQKFQTNVSLLPSKSIVTAITSTSGRSLSLVNRKKLIVNCSAFSNSVRTYPDPAALKTNLLLQILSDWTLPIRIGLDYAEHCSSTCVVYSPTSLVFNSVTIICVLFSFLIMLRLVVVVLRLIHGNHEWLRNSSFYYSEVLYRPVFTWSNPNIMIKSHDHSVGVSVDNMSPVKSSSGQQSDLTIPPLSAGCDSIYASTLSSEEGTTRITPASETPQGAIKIVEKESQTQIVGRTNNGLHQLAGNYRTAWHARGTEATSLTNVASYYPSEECAGYTKEASFNLFEEPEKVDGSESCLPQTVSTATKEQLVTTSSMRRRSYNVADRLVSILRPSSMSSLSNCSSRPVALRRLKTSHGVGDDLDSDMEDHDLISKLLQIQHPGSLENGQLPHPELETQNSNRPTTAAYPSSRQRPSIFSSSILTTPAGHMKRHSAGSSKFGQHAIPRPHEPRPRHVHHHSLSSGLSFSVISKQGVISEDIDARNPASGVFPNLSQKLPSIPHISSSYQRPRPSHHRSSSQYDISKSPTPEDWSYKTNHEDLKFLHQQVTSGGLVNSLPKSLYATTNCSQAINIELEPTKKNKKLSITNPDVELIQPPEPKLKTPSKRATQDSTHPGGLNVHSQARKVHSVPHLSSNWSLPSGRHNRGTSTASCLGIEKKGIFQDKNDDDDDVESINLASHRLSQQLVVGTEVEKNNNDVVNDENKIFSWFNFQSSSSSHKLSKRKSWLNSSNYHNKSPSYASSTLSIKKTNRLKKSNSVTRRINPTKKISSKFLLIPDFSISTSSHDIRNQSDLSLRAQQHYTSGDHNHVMIRSNNHDLHDEKDLAQTTVQQGDQEEEVKPRLLTTRSSLNNMIKFLTKSKKVNKIKKMKHQVKREDEEKVYGGSTTIRVLSSSPKTLSSENISINSSEEVKEEDKKKVNNSSHRLSRTTTPEEVSKDKLDHNTTNPYPYISNPLLSEGRPHSGLINRNITDGHFSWIPMHWNSRINSVGSFVNDVENDDVPSHSGLVITNPDVEF